MPKILLHSCCAPCGAYVIEELKNRGFVVTVFFYNPNIFPASEYELRKKEIENFCQIENIKFVEGNYEHKNWLEFIKGLEKEPEGGERCFKCYEFRLRETAKHSQENDFDYFASTLSISPHKNAEKINQIGRGLASIVSSSLPTGAKMLINVQNASSQPPQMRGKETGGNLKFYEADWKKQDGFKKSCLLAKENEFYRQNYCGCEFSQRQ